MKPVATRDAFGEALVALGAKEPRIVVLDADLSESTRSHKFAKTYPERFFQMGIQEANMISTAAGLARAGKIPFCCSFACFLSGRYDQIRVSVAYSNARLTLVGTHAGVAVGPDGYTQMGLEDLGVLRGLSNLALLQPADDLETIQMLEHLVFHGTGPAYLRLTRQKLPRVHEESYRFKLGAADVLREGRALTICASGGTVCGALEAALRLATEGIEAAVLNIHTIQPIDRETLSRFAQATGRVLTVEDHHLNGGLGSAVCEAIAETTPVRVRRVGLREFGESGGTEELLAKHHLDGPGIYAEAKAFLAQF